MDERYQPAPEIVLDDAKIGDFERLWRNAQDHGGEVAYDSPHPKYEFLCWLGQTQDVVLHGSNEMDITHFSPARRGFDANPHGNHRAIYATNDGIWPMFFAVLDKEHYKGLMRNWVWYEDADGKSLDFDTQRVPLGARKLYQFSLNADELPKRPWRGAMIYILPSATFEQLRNGDGVRTAEWASREPVRPLAKLRVEPEDFPFVDRVSGHDDSSILRLDELFDKLVAEAESVEELSDGYALRYSRGDVRRAEALEFGEVLHGFMAAAIVEVEDEENASTFSVRIRGPEALKDAIAKRMTKLSRAEARQN